MSTNPLARYAAKLKNLQRRQHLRALADNRGADFSSNDYLGLAASPSIRNALIAELENGLATGAGGSGCCAAITRNTNFWRLKLLSVFVHLQCCISITVIRQI